MNANNASSAKLTIGLLAQAGGVSVDTVRYYERRGLLRPPEKQAAGESRAYDDEHLARLWLIERGKKLGFTLSEIQQLIASVEGRDCRSIKALAETKLNSIAEQMRLLETARQTLESFLQGCLPDCEACPALLVHRLSYPAAEQQEP